LEETIEAGYPFGHDTRKWNPKITLIYKS